MPTVAELLHWDGPLPVDLCAGASGLGREISRIVRFSATRLDLALQSGDAVLVSLPEWKRLTGAPAMEVAATLSTLPVAAVMVSASGGEAGTWPSEGPRTPILLLSELRVDQAEVALSKWLVEARAREEREASELREELASVTPAHTDSVAARLAQVTGKPVLLHNENGIVERVCQPATRMSKRRDLDSGIRAAVEIMRLRAREPRPPVFGPIYDELPVADAAVLSLEVVKPICGVRYISLLAHPSEFTHRDRGALAAAFEALHGQSEAAEQEAMPDEPLDQVLLGMLLQGRLHQAEVRAKGRDLDLSGPFIALATNRSPGASASHRRDQLFELMKDSGALLHAKEEDGVVCLLPAVGKLLDHRARYSEVRRLQAAICTLTDPVSIGYTPIHSGLAGLRRAMVEAQEALRLGEAVCGPGHASTLAQLCIRQLASRAADDPTLRELRARLLGPMSAHDQSHKNDLLSTLQTYLDTGCKTVQTAELLGVHRNSVLYRLQRIVELTHVDLEDADTRWLLQFALHSAEPGVRLRETRPTPAATDTHGAVVWSRPDHAATGNGWMPEIAVTGIEVGR
jgi:purine catabolism regulator